MRAALAAGLLSLAAPVVAGDVRLGPPIDCDLARTCRVQQYVDRDPGPGAQDYRCGGLSYDGHAGTDFAVATGAEMRRGVAVLAAAGGVVAATRDGMPDGGYSPATAGDIAGRECGNGVLIRHDDGWETQYCHLRSGSVRVRKGDPVDRGAVLGLVGQSGQAEFPHVHLSVRRDGAEVDPFDPSATAACDDGAPGLWLDAPDYRPGGLIAAGFADGIPGYDAVRAGTAARARLPGDAPALVLYGFAFGGRKGDRVSIAITGPQGAVLTRDAVLDRDQAMLFRAAGKRLTGGRWPAGRYDGVVTLRRAGATIDRRTASLRID